MPFFKFYAIYIVNVVTAFVLRNVEHFSDRAGYMTALKIRIEQLLGLTRALEGMHYTDTDYAAIRVMVTLLPMCEVLSGSGLL